MLQIKSDIKVNKRIGEYIIGKVDSYDFVTKVKENKIDLLYVTDTSKPYTKFIASYENSMWDVEPTTDHQDIVNKLTDYLEYSI